MSELEPTASTPSDDANRSHQQPLLKPLSGGSGLEFGSGLTPAARAGFPLAAVGAAALIVLVAAAIFLYAGRKPPVALPTTLQPADAYAVSLPLSQLAMSESESLSGGKLTYLDGHIRNTGSRTVAGVTVQVVFANDEAMPPQIDTLALTLIRMRQPYIDVEPVSAEPLKPGDDRDFRLTFETVPDGWNTQMPEVRVIQTELR
jgi:hypothetical protein